MFPKCQQLTQIKAVGYQLRWILFGWQCFCRSSNHSEISLSTSILVVCCGHLLKQYVYRYVSRCRRTFRLQTTWQNTCGTKCSKRAGTQQQQQHFYISLFGVLWLFFPARWHLPQNGGTIFCPLHISFCGWFIMALNKLHHQGRLRDDYLPVFLARRLFSVGARGALFVIHLSKEKRQYPGTDTRQHSRTDDREQSPVGRSFFSFSCTPICEQREYWHLLFPTLSTKGQWVWKMRAFRRQERSGSGVTF